MGEMSNLFRAGKIASSGLKASRGWMNVVANNLSNTMVVDSGKRGADGNFVPYARQVPVFSKVLSEKFRENKVNEDILNGVKVSKVVDVKGKVNKVYNPSHPAARRPGTEDEGYVYYPGISVAQEMADMRVAAASYEANLAVISVSGRMMDQALSISRRG